LKRDIYENISPLDARYYKSNKNLMEDLAKYLSENSVIKYQALVEIAMISVMERYGIAPSGAKEEMVSALKKITPEEVYNEEARTRHNIRALVNVFQKYVDNDNVAPFIHLSATSEDITGTAQSLRIKDVTYRVIVPKTLEFMEQIIKIIEKEAGTVQIGRTHGQHAVPITVGYLFSGYLDRLGGRLIRIIEAADNLRGKMSGAVGAYNASSLLFDDPRKFEEDVLEELGLKPGAFSSQIIEPEYMLDYIHAIISAFGVLAQISDDIRHLQRTEIGEMGENFEKNQVGSSTMPHKRNPWNFEHVKSMWKEFMPRVITRYMDQISEHQRDLTNSASNRFIVEIITAFTISVDRLVKQFEKLKIDYENLKANLGKTKWMFLAEPLYILLAKAGEKRAHEIVKQATLKAEKEGKDLFSIVREEEAFKTIVKSKEWKSLESDPSSYIGKAHDRALAILYLWKSRADEIKESCKNYKEAGYEE